MRLLNVVLTEYPVIFLGCRLSEPVFKEVFTQIEDNLREMYGVNVEGQRPPRMILLSSMDKPGHDAPTVTVEFQSKKDKGTDSAAQQDSREKAINIEEKMESFGIGVAYYDPIDKYYSGLDDLLMKAFHTICPQPVRLPIDVEGGSIPSW